MIGLSNGISILWLVLAEEGGPWRAWQWNDRTQLWDFSSVVGLSVWSRRELRKGEGEGLGNGMTGLPENWW